MALNGEKEDEDGLELTDLSLQDNQEQQGEGEEHEQGEQDRLPLLADEGTARADRRERRARKRAAEAKRLRKQLRLLWKTLCGLLALGTVLSAAATLIASIELRRHLGRLFFALPLASHLVLDSLMALAPLLCARGDGESKAPPPVPTTQVEFQRQLRAGRNLIHARYGAGATGIDGCGCDEVTGRCRVSRGLAAWLVLVYASIDAFMSSFLAVAFSSAAWVTAVEADRTIAREWRGMHAALLVVSGITGAGAVLRVLTAVTTGAYLLNRYRLRRKVGRRETPWHPVMSRLMATLAIRQGGLLLVASALLAAATFWSWLWHSELLVHTGRVSRFEHCDPLDTTLCALPFPSSYFLEEDRGSGTGFRVNFGPKSLPYTRGRDHVSPVHLNAFDGFSTLAPILFHLEGMSADKLVGPADVGLSIYPNSSSTWLIEADTGVMIPHFTELDAMDPASPLAILQPALPLRHATRYIVAVCGMEGEMGELLPPTDGFRALVEAARADRFTKLQPDLRKRANRFSAEVFPTIRKVLGLEDKEGGGPSKAEEEAEGDPDVLGLGLGEVQLAWDFVTASDHSQLGVLKAMRAASRSWLDSTVASSHSVGADGDDRRRRERRELGSSSAAGHGNSATVEAARVAEDSEIVRSGDQIGEAGRVMEYGMNLRSRAGDYDTERVSSGERQSEMALREGGKSKNGLHQILRPQRRNGLHELGGTLSGEPDFETEHRAKANTWVDFDDVFTTTYVESEQSVDGQRQPRKRRRAASDNADIPTPAPLPYRVIKIEVTTEDEDEGSGDAGDDDDTRYGDPIVRTVWARMPIPAFVSSSTRGHGFDVDSTAWGESGFTSFLSLMSSSLDTKKDQVVEASPSRMDTKAAMQTETKSHGKRDVKTLEAGFVVRVPRCVAYGKRTPTAIVQYGHGLFGDRSEVEDQFLGQLAERGAWVLVSTDWRGMARHDLPVIARALVSKPDLLFSGIPESLMQGFVNQEAVLTLVSRRLGDFLGDKALAPPAEKKIPLTFYGISQGAVLGAGYTAFSSLLERSVLGSGGTPFAFLMPRSVDFLFYHRLLELNVPRARDVRLLLSLLQMSWDRLEAAAWLAASPEGEGDDESNTAVLMQGGTGDSEVSVIGTEILARAFGAEAVSPPAVPVWGVPEAEASSLESCGSVDHSAGSASLALYDYQKEASEVPDNDLPPPDGWVHNCVRHDVDAQNQVLTFVKTGCVVNYCDGTCERPYCRAQ